MSGAVMSYQEASSVEQPSVYGSGAFTSTSLDLAIFVVCFGVCLHTWGQVSF